MERLLNFFLPGLINGAGLSNIAPIAVQLPAGFGLTGTAIEVSGPGSDTIVFRGTLQ